MNALTELHNNPLTMSSREIAELTGKNHNHVMRDIRSMLVELYGDDGQSNFGSSYLNAQNKEQPCFNLPKDLTLTLVAGYNVKLRKRIIDRWLELEAQTATPVFQVPQTLPEALRLAADLSEKNEQMALQIEDDRPKKKYLSKRIDGVPSMAFLTPAEVSRDRCFVAI